MTSGSINFGEFGHPSGCRAERGLELRMKHFGRGRATIAALLVAVLAGGGVALYLVLRNDQPQRLTVGRAETLGKELSSGRGAELRDAVVIPRGIALDPAGIKTLTTRSFKIDPRSFRRVGSDNAYVTARVEGAHGSGQRWQVLLVQSDGLWKLDDTRQGGGA